MSATQRQTEGIHSTSTKGLAPEALILYGNGINAERELADSFRNAGARVRMLHVEDALANSAELKKSQILGFPGGFSYGDHLGSGRVLSYLLVNKLGDALMEFIREDRLVLGICNGFQVLVACGLVPNSAQRLEQEVALVYNESGRFIDTWVDLEVNSSLDSPWVKELGSMKVPVRHGEGRFIPGNCEALVKTHWAFKYKENPNGSWESVAGICDTSGKVLGMMPHPECVLNTLQIPGLHPKRSKVPASLQLFRNAVRHFA